MQSFHSCLMHCVFSTKGRVPALTVEIRNRLWPYLGGIARDHEMKALAVGGVADHVHILLSVPAGLAVAKAIQLLKGNSSKWLHETFPETRDVSWQAGYGAFSIGASNIELTAKYIRNQEEHHRTRTFREELVMFLERNGVAYHPLMLE